MKTYLYVKQHNKTGLKYFGKTTKKNPYQYTGSGVYWLRHLKVHGKDLLTLEVWEFDDIEKCQTFALDYSEKHNIVESKNWANLKPENGRDGSIVGNPGMVGKANPSYGKINAFRGKKHTPEMIAQYRKNQANGLNGNAKKITTPNGKFATLKEAGESLNKHPETISRWCNQNLSGYTWGW